MAFALPGAVAAIAMTVFAISSRRSARQERLDLRPGSSGTYGEVS
jgi:AAHS family benzoate transporter-like MFS transporter